MNDVIPLSPFNGLYSYRTERVEVETNDDGTLSYNPVESSRVYCATTNSTFAHVLGAMSSEDLWPGDIMWMFFPETFAVRLVGDVVERVKNGGFWEHYRMELLRLSGGCYTIAELWTSDLMLYDDFWSPNLEGGDSRDDEHEYELLLTDEYICPEKLTAQDSVESLSLSPQRRVVAIQPTEQED